MQAADLVNDEKMIKYGKTLKTSPVSRNTARSYMTEMAEAIASPSRQSALHKVSNISLKRQAAADPLLAAAMYARFLNQYKEDFANGLISTPMPGAHQVWNVDEMGLPPNGDGYAATFTLGHGALRGFRSVYGEKSPYWASILFASRADGQLHIPPTVVHQGASTTTLPLSFAKNLMDDGVIHASPSGYMDQDGFRKFAVHFVAFSGAKPGNFQYLYLDGHESHWDSEALAYLLNNSVRPMFLKSNDSINDQPNDNGMNSRLRSVYNLELEQWKLEHMSMALTPPRFNTVFASAWKKYISDPSLPALIVRAFAKTGIWPMTSQVDVQSPVAMQRIQLAEMFVRGDENRDKIKRMKEEHFVKTLLPSLTTKECSEGALSTDFSAADAATTPHITPPMQVTTTESNSAASVTMTSRANTLPADAETSTSLTFEHVNMMTAIRLRNVVNPDTAPKEYIAVVHKAVMDVVDKRYLKPIQELRDMMAEEERDSKIRVPMPQADTTGRYPGTKEGLPVAWSVVDSAKAVEANRKAKKEATEKKAHDAIITKGVKYLELQAVKRQFLETRRTTGDLWKVNMGLKELNPVYKAFGGTGSGLRKAELVQKISELLVANVVQEEDEDEEEEV